MMRRLLPLIGGCMLALALVACGDDTADAPPAGEPGDGTATPAAGTATPAASNGGTSGDTNGDDDGEDFEPFEFAEGESVFDLAGVNAFRQRTTATMTGDGETMSFEIIGEYRRDPPASHVRMTADESGEGLEVIQIGNTTWINFGGGWQQMDASSGMNPADMMGLGMMFSPTTFAGVDEGFDRAGTEAINGRETVRYTMDARRIYSMMAAMDPDIDDGDLTEAQFDVWVDRDAGFVVRYQMMLAGTGLDPEGGTGDARWEMMFELFDFDADVDIQPPN